MRVALILSVTVLQGCAGCGNGSDAEVGGDAADSSPDRSDAAELDDGIVADAPAGEADTGGDVACEGGSHRCDGACASDESPASCGTSCAPCPTPPRMVAICVAGACATRCADGYVMNGSECEPRPPRPVSPISGSVVTTRRPTLTWTNAPGITSARVQVCSDASCVTLLASADVTGSSFTPTADLPVGVAYWRLFGRDTLGAGLSASATWELTVAGARSSAPHATAWGSIADFGQLGFASAVIGRIPPSSANVIDAMQGPSMTFSFEAGDGERLPVEPAMGDFDGDGLVDLAVGIAADGDPFAPPKGRLDVYLGPSTSAGPLIPTEWWYGTTPHFGVVVSFAGDVNADGYGDLAVADPQGGQGEVYLLLGGPGGIATDPVTTLDPPDPAPATGELHFGDRIAGAGDLNGDGHADLAVHDQYRATGSAAWGHVFVYFGDDHGFTTPPVLLAPPSADANFGNSVHVAGDVNGDGLADLLVADANDGTAEDWVYVYFGSTASPFPTSPAVSLRIASTSAVPIGDFDADGYSDIAVLAGGVTVYAGAPSGPSSATILGSIPSITPGPYDLIGGIGDVDGDGFFDLGVVSGDTFYGYAGGTAFSPPARWSFCGPGGPDKPCYPIGLLGGLD